MKRKLASLLIVATMLFTLAAAAVALQPTKVRRRKILPPAKANQLHPQKPPPFLSACRPRRRLCPCFI